MSDRQNVFSRRARLHLTYSGVEPVMQNSTLGPQLYFGGNLGPVIL